MRRFDPVTGSSFLEAALFLLQGRFFDHEIGLGRLVALHVDDCVQIPLRELVELPLDCRELVTDL